MPHSALERLPTLTETLQIHKLKADKSLGQHFLLDLNLTRSIARLAKPLDGVNVIEIGPGPGGLTRALILEGAERVLAVEMDDRFLPPLKHIALVSGKLDIHHGDGLKVNFAEALPGPRKIVANLPYNVGTKMLIDWMTLRPRFWEQMVLMFQFEVAARICAQPGDNAYGRLAVLCQSVGACRIAMEVPARLFTPPPKVDSAVVVIDPLDDPFEDLKGLGELTHACFGQRRKMVRASLKNYAKRKNIDLMEWFSGAEVDPQARPETLSAAQFQALSTAANSKVTP